MGYEKVVKKQPLFSLKEKIKEWRTPKDPDRIPYVGSQIYFGMQGEGKTLSMVRHALQLKKKYPKVQLVSNLNLYDVDYIKFETFDELMHLFKTVSNGEKGVIYMIDEIHNYFHSHDSRSIPLWVVQVFSQQRKNRVLVLGTVQLWKDVTKVIRDQLQNIIACKKIGPIVFNQVLDPQAIEKVYGNEKIRAKRLGFFIPTLSLYEKYDTLQIINSGRSVFGDIQPINNIKVSLKK